MEEWEEEGREGGGEGTVLLRRSKNLSWTLLRFFVWSWEGSRGVSEEGSVWSGWES